MRWCRFFQMKCWMFIIIWFQKPSELLQKDALLSSSAISIRRFWIGFWSLYGIGLEDVEEIKMNGWLNEWTLQLITISICQLNCAFNDEQIASDIVTIHNSRLSPISSKPGLLSAYQQRSSGELSAKGKWLPSRCRGWWNWLPSREPEPIRFRLGPENINQVEIDERMIELIGDGIAEWFTCSNTNRN